MKTSLSVLSVFALVVSSAFGQDKVGGAVVPVAPVPAGAQAKLEPGQFEWHPELSPAGPLLIVCSIDDQMLYAYRNGVQIARSTVSTGRKGKRTPTGVFTILQRKVDHESSIYKGAKMPYMRDNFSLPSEFRAAANKVLTPGTILLATRDSSTEETRSGPMAIGVTDEEEENE